MILRAWTLLVSKLPNARRIALIGLRALYRMIFDHGFVHADLHPGNVFRDSVGRITVLDAGLVTEVDETTRADFVAFFFAVVNNEGLTCADIVWRTAIARPEESRRPVFEVEMNDFIAAESLKKSAEFEVISFVHRLLDHSASTRSAGDTRFCHYGLCDGSL